MKRWLTWVIIAIVIVGLGGLSMPIGAWLQERNAPKYLTVQVSRGRVETVVNSTGTIKPVRTVSVGAFTSGPIQEVFVDFNSEITQKDQVLALIAPKLLQATVDRDRAAVATQKAELLRIQRLLEQAQRNQKRAEMLKKTNEEYISGTEWDSFRFSTLTLVAQEELAKANILQAEANLKNSEQNLAYTKILGPKEISPEKGIRGKVIERKVDPGQTVAASFQTPELFTIALEMDKHMHVYASVDEADIGMIRAAKARQQHVRFTVDAYAGEIFDGTIHDIRMNSTTTQNVVTYPVILDAPNRDQKLMPGMTANITFQIEAKEDVLRIPASALRFTPTIAQARPEDRHYLEAVTSTSQQSGTTPKRSADEKAKLAQGRYRRIVWVQDGPLLRAVPIQLGLMENQFAEVVGGDLTEGQAIVTGLEGAFMPR
ncbi:MAG TPA: efflux RND transporter periplasmic adaptor subunit [Gemmataceae bacterium]|nr:efflux RND transporter periplasmic adaptor subunit [Gemmataceae bacterium]